MQGSAMKNEGFKKNLREKEIEYSNIIVDSSTF